MRYGTIRYCIVDGVGRGTLLCNGVGWDILISVAYDDWVCNGSSFYFMHACHEGCMSVNFRVRSLVSMRCYSVPEGRKKVNLRASMAVRSFIFGLILSLRGSLTRMASVGCMRR